MRTPLVNRQEQDLRDFMIWQDGEIGIAERFQAWRSPILENPGSDVPKRQSEYVREDGVI